MKLKDGKSYNRFAHCETPTSYKDELFDMTLCQLHQMIKLENMPETIPPYVFLRNAFASGWQWITELNGKLVSFTGSMQGGGGLGPGYDFNYLPTHIVVTNPYLNADGSIPDYDPQTVSGFSGTFPLTEGVLVKTNSELMSLTPLVSFFSELEEVAARTLRMGLITSRMSINWLAKSTEDQDAMNEYLRKIERGELGVALSKEWQETVELAVGANAGSATLLKSQIEALQYVRGYKWQTFGVQANHNMKREAINESEAGMNENSLLPFIDDIFANLSAGIEEINARYGTNIKITYNSAWREIQQTVQEVEENGIAEDGTNESDGDNPAPAGGSVADGEEPGSKALMGEQERDEASRENDGEED